MRLLTPDSAQVTKASQVAGRGKPLMQMTNAAIAAGAIPLESDQIGAGDFETSIAA